MKLKSLPRQLGYILGAQWTRDLSWTIFTILLARRSPEMLGQIAVALSCGYLVKFLFDVGCETIVQDAAEIADKIVCYYHSYFLWQETAFFCSCDFGSGFFPDLSGLKYKIIDRYLFSRFVTFYYISSRFCKCGDSRSIC